MKSTYDLSWWYWLLTASLLGGGLFAWRSCLYLAIMLCVVQIIHLRRLTMTFAAFPVQVRVAYLTMLLAGLWAPLEWLHWMQLIGTTARVLLGYCFLARALSLAPWNRRQPLTLALIRRTYCSLRANVPRCSEVFGRISLERVQG